MSASSSLGNVALHHGQGRASWTGRTASTQGRSSSRMQTSQPANGISERGMVVARVPAPQSIAPAPPCRASKIQSVDPPRMRCEG